MVSREEAEKDEDTDEKEETDGTAGTDGTTAESVLLPLTPNQPVWSMSSRRIWRVVRPRAMAS